MLAQTGVYLKSLSITAKVVLVLILIIGIGVVVTNVSGAISQWRSKRADAQVAAKQTEIDGLKAKKAELEKAAAEKEAQSDLIETENSALKELIKEKGGKIQLEQEKLDAAMETYKNDQTVTGADVPTDVRRARLCAKLKLLGYDSCP